MQHTNPPRRNACWTTAIALIGSALAAGVLPAAIDAASPIEPGEPSATVLASAPAAVGRLATLGGTSNALEVPCVSVDPWQVPPAVLIDPECLPG